MGNMPGGPGGPGGPGRGRTEEERQRERERRQEEQKRKHEAGPQRTGKKKKKAIDTSTKLPNITPSSKCRLRLLRQNRVKDYLLME